MSVNEKNPQPAEPTYKAKVRTKANQKVVVQETPSSRSKSRHEKCVEDLKDIHESDRIPTINPRSHMLNKMTNQKPIYQRTEEIIKNKNWRDQMYKQRLERETQSPRSSKKNKSPSHFSGHHGDPPSFGINKAASELSNIPQLQQHFLRRSPFVDKIGLPRERLINPEIQDFFDSIHFEGRSLSPYVRPNYTYTPRYEPRAYFDYPHLTNQIPIRTPYEETYSPSHHRFRYLNEADRMMVGPKSPRLKGQKSTSTITPDKTRKEKDKTTEATESSKSTKDIRRVLENNKEQILNFLADLLSRNG